MDSLEDRLLRASPDSQDLAISRASRRKAVWDFEGAATILDDFQIRHPTSRTLRMELFNIFFLMEDMHRCQAILDGRTSEMLGQALQMVLYLVAIGEEDRARTILANLETDIASLANPSRKSTLLTRVAMINNKIGDGARSDEAKKALHRSSPSQDMLNALPVARDYLTTDGNSPAAQPAPPLRDILFGTFRERVVLLPEHLALARRIAAPPAGTYETWRKKIVIISARRV